MFRCQQKLNAANELSHKNLILCKGLLYDIDAQVSRAFFANVIVLIKYKKLLHT